MRNPMLPLCVLLTSSASLLGCSGSAPPPSPVSGPAARAGQQATLAQQLKDIDNNPNIPAQAKEAAKANIMQHQNMDLSAGHK